MEGHEGEALYAKADGQKVYSTENLTTPEEKKRLLEEQQNRDHAYALFLLGKGPNPYEKKEEDKDNVINFPQKAA